MIATPVAVVLGLAPRNAERSHEGALKHLIFVGKQDAVTQPDHRADRIRIAGSVGVGVRPTPLSNILFALLFEGSGERLEKLGRGTLRSQTKSHREREL